MAILFGLLSGLMLIVLIVIGVAVAAVIAVLVVWSARRSRAGAQAHGDPLTATTEPPGQ